MIHVLTLFLFLLYLFSFIDSKKIIIVMTYASVVSGAVLASVAVAAASLVSSKDTATGSPWILVGGSNGGKPSDTDDTAVSETNQGVVVSNYYQILNKDDKAGEEESMFGSISDNEIKNIEENLDEGEYIAINKKKKRKKNKKKRKENKKKKESKEKVS